MAMHPSIGACSSPQSVFHSLETDNDWATAEPWLAHHAQWAGVWLEVVHKCGRQDKGLDTAVAGTVVFGRLEELGIQVVMEVALALEVPFAVCAVTITRTVRRSNIGTIWHYIYIYDTYHLIEINDSTIESRSWSCSRFFAFKMLTLILKGHYNFLSWNCSRKWAPRTQDSHSANRLIGKRVSHLWHSETPAQESPFCISGCGCQITWGCLWTN